MHRLSYDLAPAIGDRANLGMVVLKSDEVIEHEVGEITRQPGVGLYVTRIESDTEVTPETLAEMEARLPHSAALLPPSIEFDSIGYGCTSGTAVIGADRVEALVASGAKTATVTNPLNASIAACRALKVSRLAFITPYVESVSNTLRLSFAEAGIEVANFGSFLEAEEAKVARIDPRSVLAAAKEIGADPACDAVFLSCTNLRALPIIEEAERQLGKPVFSSNLALGWHLMRLSGLHGGPRQFGQLMQQNTRVA